MKTGFIGTGSMGSILVEAFIRSGALHPNEITIANRTPAKAEALAARFPGLRAAATNREAAQGAELLFLCVKPHEFKNALDNIRPFLSSDQIVVSITSPVMIEQLEEQIPCKIAKMIPSITNHSLSGATLCMYGERMEPVDRDRLERLLACISRPVEIRENFARVSSDLSSCGPAFMSLLLQKFIDAAVSETGIAREEAQLLASEMLLGTGMLLTAGGFTPETLQQRVAVPGGITAEGLRLIEKELEDLFPQLIRITHAKYYHDVDKVKASFAAPSE